MAALACRLPQKSLSSPAAQVQSGCLDKGDESSHRVKQRERESGSERDLRATAHSIREESSMKGLCFMLRC